MVQPLSSVVEGCTSLDLYSARIHVRQEQGQMSASNKIPEGVRVGQTRPTISQAHGR